MQKRPPCSPRADVRAPVILRQSRRISSALAEAQSLQPNLAMLKQGYVYILTNKRKTVLYIGVTSNLQRRIAEHKSGCGSLFARKYHLNQLVYFEAFEDIHSAIAREKSLKGITRNKKETLISSINPTWRDLTSSIF